MALRLGFAPGVGVTCVVLADKVELLALYVALTHVIHRVVFLMTLVIVGHFTV